MKEAVKFMTSFEEEIVRQGLKHNCKTVMCGHIHHPKISDEYMNSGDFCENTTCLVEDFNGEWCIVTV